MNIIRNCYRGFGSSYYSNKGKSGNSFMASMPSYFSKAENNKGLLCDKKYTDLKKAKKLNSSTEIITYEDKEGRLHKTFSGKGTDVVETMRQAVNTNKNDEVKVKKRLNYSYQKVSGMVIMAKTSVSASKAVLAARRSLSELKRKIKTSDCSDDEKQAALTHASRMIRIAYKKKKNLETEELVKKTMENDEKTTNFEETTNFERTAEDNSFNNTLENCLENKIEDKDLDDLNEETVDDENTNMTINGENIFERNILVGDETNVFFNENYSSYDEIISEENSDELMEELFSEMSDEMTDLLDTLEIVNPHMDEEHYKKFKLKHRCDEQKEIVKADMDYLKSMPFLGGNTASGEVFDISL